MNRKTTGIVTAAVIAAAAHLIFRAGRNAEFDHMVERAKKAGEIYTFLPNGDYVCVKYRENPKDI